MNQEIEINNGVVELPNSVKEKASDINIRRKEASCVLLSSVIVALAYTVCFNGIEILPLLSFSVFCPFVFIVLSLMLKYLGYMKNKHAYKWAVPICILAAFNGMFGLSIFTYGNVMFMHILFACYITSAIRAQPFNLYCFSSFIMLFRTIIGNFFVIFDVFKSITDKNRVKSKGHVIRKMLLGVLLAVPVLIVITALLVSADMVFGKLLQSITISIHNTDLIDISFLISFVIVWAYVVGYMFQAKKVCEGSNYVSFPAMKADKVVSATFLTLVNIVFLVFAVIQIAFLYGGGFLELPEGMVYSRYAREGFFQLLFVTVINFSVIFIFINILKGVNESKLIRYLLLALCGFTGVLIASSFYRMYLYIEVYGYTTLRLWVITFLVMEVFLIGVTARKLIKDRFEFTKWFVITVFIFYMVVNVTGSEYFAELLNTRKFDTVDYSDTALDYGRRKEFDSVWEPEFECWQNWYFIR